MFLKATYCTSGSLDNKVTKGGANFLVNVVTNSLSGGIISMNFINTFTALKTTAAFACANLGVTRSQIVCASRSSLKKK